MMDGLYALCMHDGWTVYMEKSHSHFSPLDFHNSVQRTFIIFTSMRHEAVFLEIHATICSVKLPLCLLNTLLAKS